MSERQAEVAALEAVSKRYRDGAREVEAVVELSLSLPPGSLWLLSGPSGSGKSTLLKLLGGLTTPTSGEVRLGGKVITHMREHHRSRTRRRMVGMVLQEASLIDGMTVQDNLLLPLVPEGGAGPKQRERAASLLEQLGLGGLAGARSERLSGGERQRVAIARALILDPPLLLLDEPTAHLDAVAIDDFMAQLATLADDTRAILIATHDARLTAYDRVERVLRLTDGRLESS